MIPDSWMPMDAFPLTINGKVDTKKLPDPRIVSASLNYVAPSTEIAKSMLEIWERLLGTERIGCHDDFFKIGGHSLLAVQAANAMSLKLGKQIRVADMFECRTIAKLEEAIASKESIEEIPLFEDEQAPLSFSQQSLWFIEQFEEGTNAYHIPMLLKLRKKVDHGKLEGVLNKILDRHTILKTQIKTNLDGRSFQIVGQDKLVLTKSSLSQDEKAEKLKEKIDVVFDLSLGLPIRAELIDISGQDYLLVVAHHIAFDGWSEDLFYQELNSLYLDKQKEDAVPTLPIQYRDYSAWQKSQLQGHRFEKGLSFWQDKLQGFEILNSHVILADHQNLSTKARI